MKIIENNADKRPWWIDRKARCVKCGSQVEYEESDTVSIGDFNDTVSASADCPVCPDGALLAKRDI